MTGTVTGMIKSFNAIAGAGALEGGIVAGGISEALITTAAGLLIAMAAVIPYHYFTSRADQIEMEIHEAGAELLDFVTLRHAEPSE
jgi:biopolymer transport protein ExbB/TolQ